MSERVSEDQINEKRIVGYGQTHNLFHIRSEPATLVIFRFPCVMDDGVGIEMADSVFEIRNGLDIDMIDMMTTETEPICLFGEEDESTKPLCVPCTLKSDGALECARPDHTQLASVIDTNDLKNQTNIQSEQIDEGEGDRRAGFGGVRGVGGVGLPLRVRVGSGLEAKLFYEFTPKEIDEIQKQQKENLSQANRLAATHRNPILTFIQTIDNNFLFHQCIAEIIGTFLMTWVITGSVSSAAIAHSQSGLWEVGIVCGLGVTMAIFCTASISGAHLNPAISLAFALIRPSDFHWKKLLPYVVSQLLGAWLAGLVNYLFWHRVISDYYEVAHPDAIKGKEGSIQTAMAFGEYTPNPSFPFSKAAPGNTISVSVLEGMLIEAWGTGTLAFIIFAVTHPKNRMIGNREWIPLIIGLTVAMLISVLAPLTQAGLNPARDFGPRLVAFMFGWGSVAIPGPRSEFWIYIVGPLLGAPVGAAVYDWVLGRKNSIRKIE